MAYWTNKVALVTGGSRGLGLAIAKALARSGASVVITARDEQQLVNASALLSVTSGKCGWLPADVTQTDQVNALIDKTIQKHGRLDAVVNCAGKSDRGLVADQSADKLRDLIELNFLAAVRVTKAAAPHLIGSRGHVVFIGSLASKSAGLYLGAYPASKFPLAAYAQQLRLELGPTGLHTLLVCPGPIARPDAGMRYDPSASGLPDAARQPGGGVRLKGIDPDWLAARVLVACERRQAELIVPARAKILFALAALWPAAGDWLVRQMTASNSAREGK